VDDPYRTAIEERIRELHEYRRWLRSYWGSVFRYEYRAELATEYRVEAGALNRVRNKARKAQHVDARGDHFVGIGR
jgi:hypothetical protein